MEEVQDQVTVVATMTTVLTCVVSGTPPPEVTWYKGNSPIINSDRIVIFGNGSLLITGTSPSDEGIYMCLASNQIGSANGTIVLTVQGQSP